MVTTSVPVGPETPDAVEMGVTPAPLLSDARVVEPVRLRIPS